MANRKLHDWSQFTLRIEINASPYRVFKAWTDAESLSCWFAYDAEIEPKKNGSFRLVDIHGDPFESKVLDIRKNRRFLFSFGSHNEQVEVTIRKVSGGSECILHQFNIRTTPRHKWNVHMGCRMGWTFFLTNLKAYLEHGIDLRSHNKRKSYKRGYINS